MNGEIINVTFPKCGTCRFAQKFDLKDYADCFGEPPTVVLLGATKDVLGRPALQLEAFVPRIHKDRAACSRYQQKMDIGTIGSA